MKRYEGTIVAVNKLSKPIKIKLCHDDDEDTFDITHQFCMTNIIDSSGTQICESYTFKISKKWFQAEQLIYPGNVIQFDANLIDGQFKNISNICGENPYGTKWDTNQRIALPRDPGHIGCYFCKHYDMKSDRHKDTCYKRNTWNR